MFSPSLIPHSFDITRQEHQFTRQWLHDMKQVGSEAMYRHYDGDITTATHFSKLFSLDELDAYIDQGYLLNVEELNKDQRSRLHYGKDIKLVKRTLGPNDEHWTGQLPWDSVYINSSVVRSAFRAGFSVVLNRVNGRSFLVGEFCAGISALFGYRVNANIYVTPRRAQAFEAHFDPMSVLVVQLAGSKLWSMHQHLYLTPFYPHAFKPSAKQLNTLTATSLTMQPGHMLYLPSGILHQARTGNEEMSLHLTVGLEIDPIFTVAGFFHLLFERLRSTSHHPSIPETVALHHQWNRSVGGTHANLLESMPTLQIHRMVGEFSGLEYDNQMSIYDMLHLLLFEYTGQLDMVAWRQPLAYLPWGVGLSVSEMVAELLQIPRVDHVLTDGPDSRIGVNINIVMNDTVQDDDQTDLEQYALGSMVHHQLLEFVESLQPRRLLNISFLCRLLTDWNTNVDAATDINADSHSQNVFHRTKTVQRWLLRCAEVDTSQRPSMHPQILSLFRLSPHLFAAGLDIVQESHQGTEKDDIFDKKHLETASLRHAINSVALQNELRVLLKRSISLLQQSVPLTLLHWTELSNLSYRHSIDKQRDSLRRRGLVQNSPGKEERRHLV